MRPPPEPGRDFQNRARGQTLANSRKNCAGPLRGRAAPRLRPFLARLFPIILHLCWGRNRTADTCIFSPVSRDRKLFASAAAIQPSAAALGAGLMEQEQYDPCSAVLP